MNWPWGGQYFMIAGRMRFHVDMTGETKQAAWRHVAPFLAWVVIMSLPMADVAFRYSLQAVACVAVLCAAKPSRYYTRPVFAQLPWAVLVGMAVCVLWVLPESPWAERWPWFHDLYMRYATRGGDPAVAGLKPYAPENCGWLLTSVRLAGSAFVIAVAEEYFWRGFLMRWLRGHLFTAVDPCGIGWGVLMASSLLFGLEHSRWLAGVGAGLVYGFLYIRTGNLWMPIIAHVVTNLLLGFYVLSFGAYKFW